MATRTTAAVPACLVGFVDNDDITTNKVYLKHNLISCTHSTHLSNCQTCSKLENSLHPCCSILPLECLLGVVSQGHHRHRTDEPRGHNFSGLHEPRPQCQGHRTGSSRRKECPSNCFSPEIIIPLATRRLPPQTTPLGTLFHEADCQSAERKRRVCRSWNSHSQKDYE